MNYLLFLTLIVILLFYVFYGFFKKEKFICFKDQILNYVNINNYDQKKDAGIMIDYNKNINFNAIDYKNLEHRKSLKQMNIKNCLIKNKKEYTNYKKIHDLIKTNLILDKKYSNNNELSIYKIKVILNSLLYNNSYDDRYNDKYNNRYVNIKQLKLINEEIDTNKYSYYLIKKFILEQINKEYYTKFKNNLNFKSINEHILSYKIDYYNNFEEYEIQMIIYKDYIDNIDNNLKYGIESIESKTKKSNLGIYHNNYTIYINILFDNYNIKYYIKNIFIVGINIKDKILFQDLLNNKNSDYETINYKNKNENNKIISEEKIKDFLEDDKYVRNIIKENNRGICFFKNTTNKLLCESSDKNGDKVGVWDKSCMYNEDCPYYKRNRNYPNSRGGCINGYCEMPINLKRVGYKKYVIDKLSDIICYNCKNNNNCVGLNCNKCCEEQKDISKYPNLEGPDYAFEKDYNDRIKHNKEFKKKNMSPIKLIL